MTRINLLPPFEVGEPLNGGLWHGQPYCVGIPYPCRIAGRDYSGKDPEIQFPAGYHVNTGARLAEQMGGFHQNPYTFEPDRCRVEHMPLANGRTVNGIKLLAGKPGRSGGVAITRPFDREVFWASGQAVKLVVEFMPTAEADTFLFDNIELRGLRNDDLPPEKAHMEPVEAISLTFSTNTKKALWWRDRKASDTLGNRQVAESMTPLAIGAWHRLVVTMTPTAHPYEWALRLRLRVGTRAVWKVDLGEGQAPNGIVSIQGMMFGNEHSTAKNEIGGVWLYRLVRAVAIGKSE